MYYLQENMERLAQEAKGTGEGYMKLAGAEWKAIEDKSKWEELAAEDKERYQNEKGEPSPEPEKSVAKKKAAATTSTSKQDTGGKAKGAKSSSKK
jgi:structure-specific recognition protein 1